MMEVLVETVRFDVEHTSKAGILENPSKAKLVHLGMIEGQSMLVRFFAFTNIFAFTNMNGKSRIQIGISRI